MSRYSHVTESGDLVEYGYDPAPMPGYFYSVEENGELVEAGDTRGVMICQPEEEQINRSEIGEKLRKFGVRDDHVDGIFMDQPI